MCDAWTWDNPLCRRILCSFSPSSAPFASSHHQLCHIVSVDASGNIVLYCFDFCFSLTPYSIYNSGYASFCLLQLRVPASALHCQHTLSLIFCTNGHTICVRSVRQVRDIYIDSWILHSVPSNLFARQAQMVGLFACLHLALCYHGRQC